MRAVIRAYKYNGAHANYDRRTGQFVDESHWDWRYKIVMDGFAIYYRSGFCSWEAAAKSLAKAWPRMEEALRDGEALTEESV